MASRKKIMNYLAIAAQVAIGKEDRRTYFLGSLGVRGDGAIVTSFNSSTNFPVKAAHSEARLAKKLNYGSVVYIARILASGHMALSRPCAACLSALRARGCVKIYYTIDDNEFGTITLSNRKVKKEVKSNDK